MVDGSARFVGNDIESKATQHWCGPDPEGPPAVWQAMHTRSGGELVDGF